MACTALRLVPPSIPNRPSPVSTPPPPPPSPSPAISNPRIRIPNFSTIPRSRSSSVHGPLRELPDDPDPADLTFDRAVALFNAGDYHRCHDYLEELWTAAEEPAVRTALHGILQCAVGFHHLFNQNHRGAMMEMGEGLCKLRKIGFERGGPLFRFERDVSEVLEFVYHTQLELAACAEDLCITMDGSERSYQLLGSFAAGQHLYSLEIGVDGVPYILFSPSSQNASEKSLQVRVPILTASEEHLKACGHMC